MFDSLVGDLPESLVKSLLLADGMEAIIDSKLLQEDGFSFLLEDGTGFILLESGE